MIVSISKVEVLSYAYGVSGGVGEFILYKPTVPISNYLRVIRKAPTGIVSIVKYEVEHNSQWTKVNASATTESDFYNPTSSTSFSYFRITMNVKDASGGAGFKENNIFITQTGNLYPNSIALQ